MLEDAFMPKFPHVQTFHLMNEIDKHIPKVASSSTIPMTLIKEHPTLKLDKIHIP
jgi:hypothetical protein